MGQTQGKEGKEKLTSKDIDHLEETTDYTREQIKKWYQTFMEECPTGKMTPEIFQKQFTNLYPRGDATRFCRHAFRTFDRNKNGVVDFKEFLFVSNLMSSGDPEQKLKYAFEMYDIDSNGTIEREEVRDILQASCDLLFSELPCGNSASEKADMIMLKFDENNDKKLSREEFIKGCMSDGSILQALASGDAI